MFRIVVLCFLFLNTAVCYAIPQDGLNEVIVEKPREGFRVKRAYFKTEFDKVWKRITKEAKRVETLSGRVWVREYSGLLWDRIAVAEEPVVTFPPERAFVCDFASDFVEMRTRQDWYDVTNTKVDFSASFTLDARMHFDLRIPDSLRLRERRIRTIDRDSRFVKAQVSVELPEKMGRAWPTILDFRVAGWTSTGQWMIPTDMDQWLRILDSFEPFSLTTNEDGDIVIVLYQWRAERKCIWEMTFDSKTLSPKGVIQYRAVNQLEDKTLMCVKGPISRSVIFSDPKSGRKCVVLGSESNSLIQRLDFMVEEDDFLADDFFEPELLSPTPVPISYSPALKAIMAAALEKTSPPKNP